MLDKQKDIDAVVSDAGPHARHDRVRGGVVGKHYACRSRWLVHEARRREEGRGHETVTQMGNQAIRRTRRRGRNT
jgi:hypothetical protein